MARPAGLHSSAMIYLVFDIETAALPFEQFDRSQQEYLLRDATNDDEREQRKRLMSLNPLTAQIVALGMVTSGELEGEGRGMVFSSYGAEENGEPTEDYLSDGSRWCMMSERELLKRWWDVLARGNASGGYSLISFNGRGFDCPFLMLRSAALRIKPRRNLMDGTRWKYDRHIDLQEELAFKNNDRNGAMRRFNFDFYCKSFGIKSPKGEGITGSDVPEFYRQGRHREIAEYCLRDVRATWELFKFWKEYLSAFEA